MLFTYAADKRINTIFQQSSHWRSYDVFARQKISTFRSSRPAVLELAKKYKELTLEATNGPQGKPEDVIEQAEKLLFTEMCEICLWGNATDLSLLTSLTYEDIQKLQGSAARKAAEDKIIVNDISAAYEVLSNARCTKDANQDRRVDFVLDNAGFELFVDLILAGYLLSSNLATIVVFHPKTIPWFVSDVIASDLASLFNAIADPQTFFTQPDDPTDNENGSTKTQPPLSAQEVDELTFLLKQWGDFHREGRLILRPDPFWTGPGSYWRLPTVAPELFKDLQLSELVIFKGDLNYRKLTADVWKLFHPFPLPPLPFPSATSLKFLSSKLPTSRW